MKRIHPSGFQKRNEQAKRAAASVESVPKIYSFFNPDIVAPGPLDSTEETPAITIETPVNNDHETDYTDDSKPILQSVLPVPDHVSNSNNIETVQDKFFDEAYPTDKCNFDDPIVDTDLKKKIVLFGPCQPNVPFKPNKSGRKFSIDYYSIVTKSGIKIKREWLCYSVKNDTVYCDSCWLFSDRQSPHYHSDWVNGMNDWQHLSQKIKVHQQSQQHINAVILHQRWKRGECIDDGIDEHMREEKKEWIKVLHHLIDIVLTLAENNLAFRGDHEVLNESHSGNFLSLVALVARYDPVLEQLVKKPAGSCRYLSPSIQNELISITGSAVKNKLLDDIRGAPFYTVMADGTQDITKHDQFSCVIRYVLINSDNDISTVEVKESFLGFFDLVDQSAQGIEMLLVSILSDLDINKCRGQGYDGASVMSGKLSGVQKRMQDRVSNALYVHCSAHNLNLILSDAAEECVEVKAFFGVIQEVYNYLGSSAPRWAVLNAFGQELSDKLNRKNNVTIKKLCPTR